MFRGGRGPRPLPPYDGRVTKAATHSTTTRATVASMGATTAAAVAAAAAAATAPPPGRTWIGDCADSALLEDYFSGSDRDDYPAAPVEAGAAMPFGGTAAPRFYASESAGGGVGGSLPFSYANELWLLPLDAASATASAAAPAGAPPGWISPPQAKVEPPDGSVYGAPPQPLVPRPAWERDAYVNSNTTAAVRGGGGGLAPQPAAARPVGGLFPAAALSPLAVGNLDTQSLFEPLDLNPPSVPEPSDVTGATAVVSDPEGAHLHKRELADPPTGVRRARGGVGAHTVEVEAASSSGGSYIEARVSPSTLTEVSRPAPAEAGGVAATRRAAPGQVDANGERRLEWDKPPPPAVMCYSGGGVGGVVGLASSTPPVAPAPAMAAMTTATESTYRGAATLAASAVAASGRVPAGGGGGRAVGTSTLLPLPANGGGGGKPKRFECDQCGQLFTERSNRKKHVEAVHLKLRPHGCSTCGAEFAAKVNLHKHIQSVHEKARPFPCGACGAAFGERNKRDKHTRTVHGGERPWPCELCGHAFGQRSDLVRHAKIVHEGVRPHECPQPGCDKSFGRRGSLVHHLMVIHKVTSG